MNRFTCHQCGKRLSYRMEQLGKRIKCPKCQCVLQCGMQQKPDGAGKTETASAGYSAYERRQLLMASGLLVVAAVMLWYAFFA